MRRERWLIAMGAALAMATPTTLAHAAPTPEDSKRADTLFDEGTRWMDQGDFARACPSLQQSLAIDPAVGTALALARCHEKAGRLATAWAAYLDAESRARASGQTPRANAARDQAAALAPRLSRLAITVSAQVAATPGLVIELDGLAMATTALGTQIPVDPGEHRVEARAPGRRATQRTVVLAEAESGAIAFASLEAEQAGDSEGASEGSTPGSKAASDAPSALFIAGVATAGVGVAGLGLGAVFGVLAAGASSDSDAACAPFEAGRGGAAARYDDCVAQRRDAGTLADVSTIAFIAGGVLAAAGVGIILLGGAEDDEAALLLLPGPTSLTARGIF